MKRFLEWIGLKEKIDQRVHTPPHFKEGEIWWCYIGENIGIEINGKSGNFTRPILVYRKYDQSSFLGLPLSTQPKRGNWYECVVFAGIEQTVSLTQGRTYDYRRLKDRVGQLGQSELERIKEKYRMLH